MHTTRTPRPWKTAIATVALAGAGIVGVGAVADASYGDEPPVVEDTGDDADDTSSDTATDTSGETGDAGDDAVDSIVESVETVTDDGDGVETDGETGRSGRRGFRNSETVAEVLGMTQDEVRAARGEGLSIAAMAEQQGVALDVVIDAIVDDAEERIAAKVAAGDLTQEEADARLEIVADRAAERVERIPGEGCGDDADDAEVTDT